MLNSLSNSEASGKGYLCSTGTFSVVGTNTRKSGRVMLEARNPDLKTHSNPNNPLFVPVMTLERQLSKNNFRLLGRMTRLAQSR